MRFKNYGLSLLKDYAILIALVLAIIVLAVVEPAFLTFRNLRNLLDQNAGIGIIASGMTYVIIGRGFDLSVSATFAVSGIAAALVSNASAPTVGLMSGVVIGTLIGLANGILIARLQLNSFLITLASSIVIRGCGIAMSGGYLINVTENSYSTLGRGTVYGITYPSIAFILFVLISMLVLHRTQYGRYIFAVGGNEEAALLSGIEPKPSRDQLLRLLDLRLLLLASSYHRRCPPAYPTAVPGSSCRLSPRLFSEGPRLAAVRAPFGARSWACFCWRS